MNNVINTFKFYLVEMIIFCFGLDNNISEA